MAKPSFYSSTSLAARKPRTATGTFMQLSASAPHSQRPCYICHMHPRPHFALRAATGLAAAFLLPLSAATVDGLKLHSSVAGSGPKTVILVHGWTCDDTTWTEQVPALAKQYRVVTL